MNPVAGSDETATGSGGESLVSLLAQLHDLREPPPVPMWPATPIWTVIAVVVLVLAVLGLRLWLRHRRARAYRRAALAELRALAGDLRGGGAQALVRLDRLIRRTALAGFPRSEVAALSGDDWAAFLSRTGGAALAGHVPAMSRAAFAPSAPAYDGLALARAARDWIRHHHA